MYYDNDEVETPGMLILCRSVSIDSTSDDVESCVIPELSHNQSPSESLHFLLSEQYLFFLLTIRI